MPYKTTTGVGSTSIKFAIGNQVSVNCLIRMSFIQMAKLHIDLEDNVVQSSVLQMDPVKLSFQRPQKHLPANIPANQDASATTLNSNIVSRIDECIDLFQKDQENYNSRVEVLHAALNCLKLNDANSMHTMSGK